MPEFSVLGLLSNNIFVTVLLTIIVNLCYDPVMFMLYVLGVILSNSEFFPHIYIFF